MVTSTLPTVVLRLKLDLAATAVGAEDYAVRPTARNQVLAAVGRILKVKDCFLKSGGFGYHGLTISSGDGIVKYIFTFMNNSMYVIHYIKSPVKPFLDYRPRLR
jgi:hypothetical protein